MKTVLLLLGCALTACVAAPPPAPASPPEPCPPAAPAAPAPAASSGPAAAVAAAPAVPIDLPRAADLAGPQQVLTIDLDARGGAFVDGRALGSDEELLQRAREASAQRPEVRAVVRADASVTHGRVVRVMDLVKQAGIQKIAFAVQRADAAVAGGSGSAPADFTSMAPASDGAPGAAASVRPEDPWKCAFPKAADEDEVDEAVVVLQVAVDARGRARWARIHDDPGHGFGMAALQCALARRYTPAQDRDGKAIAGMTPKIRVRFER